MSKPNIVKKWEEFNPSRYHDMLIKKFDFLKQKTEGEENHKAIDELKRDCLDLYLFYLWAWEDLEHIVVMSETGESLDLINAFARQRAKLPKKISGSVEYNIDTDKWYIAEDGNTNA